MPSTVCYGKQVNLPQTTHLPPIRSRFHRLGQQLKLPELTEDEQDSTEIKPKAIIRKQPTRRTQRSLIPDQMWSLSEEKSKPSEPPDSSTHADHRNSVDKQSRPLTATTPRGPRLSPGTSRSASATASQLGQQTPNRLRFGLGTQPI